jgi:hypothetical protein
MANANKFIQNSKQILDKTGTHVADCQSVEIAEMIAHRVNAYDKLVDALIQSKRLIEEALPKFNWGASFLGGDEIAILNETPGIIGRALAIAKDQS